MKKIANNLFDQIKHVKIYKKSNSIKEEIKMSINNFKHAKVFIGVLATLAGLTLVGCLNNPIDIAPEVDIIDETPPIILVTGFTNEQTTDVVTNIIAGDGFVIPGATAVDDIDGPVPVTTNDGGYNNYLTNMYQVTYSAVDSNHNSNTFILTIVVEDAYDPDGFHVETGVHKNVVAALASDRIVEDRLGRSVAIDGDYAIVGAPNTAWFRNGASGSAYIFKRDGTNWTQQKKLTANDDSDVANLFGNSVSLSGDYAVVGAPYDDDKGASSGAVYIFKRDGTNWIQQKKLTANDGAQNDNFGVSVAIDGGYVIVGAYLDDDIGYVDSGSAYMFSRTGTNWIQQAKLTASDRRSSDQFASSVDINEDSAIVGTTFNNGIGFRSGAAYVFKRNGASWRQQAKLFANDGNSFDYFGFSVAIEGDTAIVGANRSSAIGSLSGAVYIYNRDGIDWFEQTKITSSIASFQGFGGSIAIDGDYLVVGSTFFSSGNMPHIFNYDGTNWIEKANLVNQYPRRFGYSVGISGDYAIIGNYGNAIPNIYRLRR